jgi:hypothetical protein
MGKVSEAFSKFFTVENWKKVVGLIISIVILIGLAIGLPMLLCSKPIPPMTTEGNPQETHQIEPSPSLVDTLSDIMNDMIRKKTKKK